ncbi:sensor histidine kinase [Halobaculum marinum]|uniref:Sensor histidine kinase n=1 Tax=Halobaculum marinum TaxID=3031996 RepID=A0ABD5WUT2_9EURY|nr:sensor histidine kinase [Halobaculum sp. DT55]
MSQSDSRETLDSGTVRFSSDSKLLSEIGERLIATPDIALSELIKNAYDADATKCNIWLKEDSLFVKDDGHGMTEQEFRDYWMTIATNSRLEQETSKRYNRELTGAKGVGRFAVRNLGLELSIETVAWYEEHQEYRQLTADLKWGDFESGQPLESEEVTYQIETADVEEEGTTLEISQLQSNWTQDELEEVSGEVLDIISAPYQTNRSEMQPGGGSDKADPGFSVYFAPPGEGAPEKSAAQEIYERYVMKVEISVRETTVRYDCEYKYGYDDNESESRVYEFNLGKNLLDDVFGEIRYFNWNYSGLFRNLNTIDGRSVPKWLRNNGGVRIIDKNFRVPPYGDELNDWLNISESQARRERQWRSTFTSNISSGGGQMLADTKQHQLNLPSKNQILGSLNVSSYRPGESEDVDESLQKLVPAMDRQGFIENEAMDQLRDIARGAIEIIAILDKEEELRRKRQKAKESKSELKSEIEQQQKEIEEELESAAKEFKSETNSTTNPESGQSTETKGQLSIDDAFSNGDVSTDSPGRSPSAESADSLRTTNDFQRKINEEIKPKIEQSYSELSEKVDRYEQAEVDFQSSVESMYLMSAVAAFMTHETNELLRSADQMIEAWEETPENERSEALEHRLDVTREARDKFEKQLGYSKRFMQGLEEDTQNELFVKGKTAEIIEQFSHYTDRKQITIEHKYPEYIKTPEVNPSVYTGVLMNLFTNAIKAVLEVPPENNGRIIRFEAENTDTWHKLRVADTGSGIPSGLENRIFDPLFSTTENRDDDPLGAGVGLGLYVVRRIVENSDGEISVVEAPEDFETCFEVRFKR